MKDIQAVTYSTNDVNLERDLDHWKVDERNTREATSLQATHS